MDIKTELNRFLPMARTVLGLASGQPELLGPVDLTVLFTDIDDYSGVVDRLGDREAYHLVRVHNAVARSALRSHGGVEVKQTGDGMLGYFLSASRAVECALAIQRDVAAYTRSHPELPLKVAIGINTGAPILEGGDLFGTAVVIAARITDMAAGGEILVSDVVRQLSAGKGFHFHYVGEEELEGLQERVRIFAVESAPVALEAAGVTSSGRTPR